MNFSKLPTQKIQSTQDDTTVKPKDITAKKWAEEGIEGNIDTIADEKKISFSVRVPESLSKRLDAFIETKALRHESKNHCYLKGLEMFLDSKENDSK